MYDHKSGIQLRKVTKEDLPELLALKNESWWGTHGTLIANPDDQLQWYETFSDRELCVIGMKDSAPVGVGYYSNIDWVNQTMSVSGSMFKASRTAPLISASYAAGLDFVFEILNMFRVNAEVLECNVVAQRIHIQHLGFKVEGCRRKAVYKSGRYYDSILLGLLREEWEQQDRVKSYGGSCNTNFDHDFVAKMMRRFNVGATLGPLPMDEPRH